MNTLYNLLDDLMEIEGKLYSSKIHQATIDIVENCYEEVNDFLDNKIKLNENFLMGSLCYKVGNLIEICKEDSYDYKILTELYNTLNKYTE